MPQQRAGGKHAMDSLQGDVFWSGNEKPHKCLRTFKLTIQTFSKTLKLKTVHLQMYNMVALTYLFKIGGYPEFKASLISKKKIGDHLL